MIRFARILRALADRIDPPARHMATATVYFNGQPLSSSTWRIYPTSGNNC